jgi:hypothetical protein
MNVTVVGANPKQYLRSLRPRRGWRRDWAMGRPMSSSIEWSPAPAGMTGQSGKPGDS